MNKSVDQHSNFELEGIDLRSLLYILLENKWILLGFILLGFAIGLFSVFTKKPQYSTSVLMQVMAKQSNGLDSLAGLGQQFNFGGDMNANSASVQMALIKSRFILLPVVRSLNLDISAVPYQFPIIGRFLPKANRTILVSDLQVPQAFNNKNLILILDNPEHISLYDAEKNLILEGPVGVLLQSPDKTFSLKVRDIEGPKGAKFVITKQSDTEVIDKLQSYIKITDLGTALENKNQNTGILQLSLKGGNPRSLVNILNAIAKVVQEKDIQRKSLEAEKTLSFLNQQLPIVRNALENAETKLNVYRAKSGRIDLKLQTQSLMMQLNYLNQELSKIRIGKANMVDQYTASHPFMIAMNEKYKALMNEQQALQAQLKTLPASDQIAANLMRDVNVKNALYLVLLNKIQELQVTKAGTISDIRILSLATLPDDPLPAGRLFTLFASMLFCFGLGCGFVFLRRALFNNIEDPNWVEQKLGLINLAIVPHSKLQSTNLDNYANRREIPLLSHISPQDITIEAIRSLRTGLFMSAASANNNIVGIMGISPGIGKSFISSNFAYILAEAGKRVLLIDGDIRRGYLQDYFHVEKKPGLTEVIKKHVTLEQAIKKTFNENLSFLATGAYPSNPSELLLDPYFKEVIFSLSKQYDFVVIDTAPILAVTDAALIGAMAGTNYLMVGSGVHQAKEIEVAIKRLTTTSVKLDGYIFNYLKPQTKMYGNSQYNYHYAYETKTN